MKITVAIVFHNEAKNLARLFQALAVMDWPAGCDLVLIDNDSTDQSWHKNRSILESMDISTKYIRRHYNHLGESRAQAILLAQNPWVAFIDADCVPAKDWLTRYQSLAGTLSTHTSAIGSYNEPDRNSSIFQSALWDMSKTFFGNFNAPQMSRHQKSSQTSHLPTCNVLYRRDAVLEAGNFSRDFPRVCEDVELNLRLGKKYQLQYTPDNPVIHNSAAGYLSWMRKMWLYGAGQWSVIEMHPGHFKSKMLLPLAFIPTMIFALFFFPEFFVFYLACLFFVALTSVSRFRLDGLISVWLSLLCTHFSYGSGMLFGFFKYLIRAVFYGPEEKLQSRYREI